MEVSAADRDLAIKTLIGEEGSFEGQSGVAAVILNRLASGRFGDTLGDVILAPYQFTPWNQPRTPDEMTRQSGLWSTSPESPAYQRAARIFDAVRTGDIPDPTNGATHFYAPRSMQPAGSTPSWATGEGVPLGNTLFYAPQGPVERKTSGGQDEKLRAGLTDLGTQRQLEAEGQKRQAAFGAPPKQDWMAEAPQPFAAPAPIVAPTPGVPQKADWMSEAPQPYTPPGTQPGFVEKGISSLGRAATEGPGIVGGAVKEGVKTAFQEGQEEVASGIAAMKSGDPKQFLPGLWQDIHGTIEEATGGVPSGLVSAGLKLSQYLEPTMGMETPHVAAAAEHLLTPETQAARTAEATPRPAVEPAAPSTPPQQSWMAEPPRPVEPTPPRQSWMAEPPKPVDVGAAMKAPGTEAAWKALKDTDVANGEHGISSTHPSAGKAPEPATVTSLAPKLEKLQKAKQTAVDQFYTDVASYGTHTKLPMDEESRLKRAKEQGFNTELTLYHGTGKSDFLRFEVPKYSSEPAVFLSDNPKVAGAYTKKGGEPNIIPIWSKMTNPKTVDFGGVYSPSKMASILKQAKQEGHDAVIIKNILDIGSGEKQTQYAFFKPENLRAKYGAAFDPAVTPAKAHMLSASSAPPTAPLPEIPPRAIIAEQEDRFFRIRQAPVADKAEALRWIDTVLPPEMKNPEILERLYLFMENPNHPLTPEEYKLFETYVAPWKKEELERWERVAKTDLKGIEDFDPTYAHRQVKGRTPGMDPVMGQGEAPSPLGGRTLKQSTSSMKDRVFFAIQSETGERKVVARDEDGHLRIIEKGQPATPVKVNTKLKVGDAFYHDGQAWTFEQARTPEIEAQTDISYYKNALSNTIDNVLKLRQVERGIFELERLKASPEWQQYAFEGWDNPKAPRDYIEPKMPLFRGWKVQPKLAYAIDDFYGRANSGNLEQFLTKINRLAIGSMFWTPVAHLMNVAFHHTIARGWDWVKPSGVKSLMLDGAEAMREVMTLGPKYQEMLREGSGMLYGAVRNQEFYSMMMKRLGDEVARNPAKWDPIARLLGVGPSDLARMYYGTVQRGLWAGSDMFMMQRVLELQRKNMSMRDAIKDAERHIPNYRIPSEVLKSRMVSEFIQNPAFTEFSRYHYDFLESWANIAKDMFGPPQKNALGESRRVEAIGQVMALAAIMGIVNPGLNWVAQQTFGPNAKFMPRGPATLLQPAVDWLFTNQWIKDHAPQPLLNLYNGDSSYLLTLGNLLMFAPVAKGVMESVANLDFFTGRHVREPADERAGRVPRVAGQELEHAAQTLVQPYQLISRLIHGDKSVPKGIAEQALGVSEPNREGKAKVFQRQEKEAARRSVRPQGLIEQYLGKLPWFSQ